MLEKKLHPVHPTMRSLLNLTYMQTAEDSGPVLGKEAGEVEGINGALGKHHPEVPCLHRVSTAKHQSCWFLRFLVSVSSAAGGPVVPGG